MHYYSNFYLLSRYIGYMESITKEDVKKQKRKDSKKKKDKEAQAKNMADGTELSEVKVEVAPNQRNQHLEVQQSHIDIFYTVLLNSLFIIEFVKILSKLLWIDEASGSTATLTMC